MSHDPDAVDYTGMSPEEICRIEREAYLKRHYVEPPVSNKNPEPWSHNKWMGRLAVGNKSAKTDQLP